MIEAEKLTKVYPGGHRALNDVSLKVPPGTIGLLGPNGAGKSTFIKCLLNLETPTSGVARVLGCDIRTSNRESREKVGYSPEQDSHIPGMVGCEYVTYCGQLSGLSFKEARQRAHEILDLVGMGQERYRGIDTYSTGMKQRVKLAQALVHDPELLILDEPLTGMDPLMRRKTIRFIKDWARTGKHIIVSSHILHEIESMTSNILLINNGRIVAEGNVHQIRDLIDTHPHTVYVRGSDPRALARRFLAEDDVLSLRFEPGAVVVETARPDSFYARLTELAASGEAGAIDEVQSPDDNLQAVFRYLVKQ